MRFLDFNYLSNQFNYITFDTARRIDSVLNQVVYLYEESHEDLKVLYYQRSNLIDAFICLPNLLMKFLCSSVSVSLSNSSNSVKKVQASLTKVTAVQSDDMNRSTNSLTRKWSNFSRSYIWKKLRSEFQILPSRIQLVEDRLLCLSSSRFERFSASLVCNVLLILSWQFPPLLEYSLLSKRS